MNEIDVYHKLRKPLGGGVERLLYQLSFQNGTVVNGTIVYIAAALLKVMNSNWIML